MWSLNRCLKRDEFYSDLSHPLATEIRVFLYAAMVKKVPYFANVERSVILKVVSVLADEIFLRGDFLVREGELGGEMYFLRRGTVAVFKRDNPNVVFTTLEDGTFFGEVGLQRGIKRTAMIQARSTCDTVSLRVSKTARMAYLTTMVLCRVN